MKHKLESRLAEEISITSDMQMTPPLWQKTENCGPWRELLLYNLLSGKYTIMAESEEELKSLLMNVK